MAKRIRYLDRNRNTELCFIQSLFIKQSKNYLFSPISLKAKKFLDLAEYKEIFPITRILTEYDKSRTRFKDPCQYFLTLKTEKFLTFKISG